MWSSQVVYLLSTRILRIAGVVSWLVIKGAWPPPLEATASSVALVAPDKNRAM